MQGATRTQQKQKISEEKEIGKDNSDAVMRDVGTGRTWQQKHADFTDQF